MTTLTDMAAAGLGELSPARRRRPNRIIAFGLSGEEWDRLCDLAVAELRDPQLQARWLVLQALRAPDEEAAS